MCGAIDVADSSSNIGLTIGVAQSFGRAEFGSTDSARVRIEQQLGRIKAHASFGRIRTMDPKTVALSGATAGHIAVKYVVVVTG